MYFVVICVFQCNFESLQKEIFSTSKLVSSKNVSFILSAKTAACHTNYGTKKHGSLSYASRHLSMTKKTLVLLFSMTLKLAVQPYDSNDK